MTMVVPSEVIIIPLFLIIKNLGWLNTFKALILPLPTAFGVFIMRQAILDIPDDLINAAKIDGCGRLRIFFKVVLPMVKSSIIALSIFTFVGAWNNFFMADGVLFKTGNEDVAIGTWYDEDIV